MRWFLSLLFILFHVPALLAVGNVTGTVTSSSGSPISGATVQLIRGAQQVIGTTATAGDGSYSFSNVNAGNYTVTASVSGYQTGSVGVHVSNGQTSIGDVALSPNPGSIAGQVTDADTHAAISGAAVNAYQSGVLVGSTTTNGSGNYTLAGLAPVSTIVTVSASGYQTSSLGALVQSDQTITVNFALSSSYGNVSGNVSASGGGAISGALVELNINDQVVYSTTTDGSGNYAMTGIAPGSYIMHAHATNYQTGVVGVTVQASATSTVNFTLDSSPGFVAGIVTAAVDGSAIPGVLVEANLGGIPVVSVLTGSDGTYTLTGLVSGSYEIHAHATDYQTGIAGAIVTAGQTTTVNFSLQSNPGTVSGTVTATSGGAPIAGALVELNVNNTPVYSTLTDPSGAYTLTGVIPGSYVMHAHADTYQTGITGVTVQAGQTSIVNFSLESNPGIVTGTVTAESGGAPIEGALVELNVNDVPLYSTLTDASGFYAISGAPPGSYIVHAHANNYQTGIVGAIVQAGGTTTVDFSLVSNPGTVVGIVSAAATGLPIPNALVELNVSDVPIYSTLTDSTGAYTISGVPPGSYVVHAHATGYQVGIQGVTITAGNTSTVNFSLANSPGSVAGTVTAASSGLPIASALVEVNLNNIPITSILTDSSGYYTLTGLASGSYVMHAHANDYGVGIQNVTITAGETSTVNFSLSSNPGTVEGTVTSNGVTPVSGAIVEVNLNGIVLAFTLTDAAGIYSISGISAGDYVMHVHATGYAIGIEDVAISAGHTTTANFTLSNNPATVQGQISSFLTTDPIVGAFALVYFEGSLLSTAITDSGGNYSIDILPAGSFTITGNATGYYSKSADFTVSAGDVDTINFALIPNSPPQNLTGRVIVNRFLLQADRIHHIQWQPSQDPTVTQYYVTRDGILAAVITANGLLEYNEHNCSSKKAIVYSVYDLNSSRDQSSSVSITLQ